MKTPLEKKSKIESLDSKKYIVIDCSTLAYAALYSYGHLSYGNEPTGVIFGFLTKLLSIAEKFNTNNFVFCWDSKWTYREKDYKGYKEKRHNKELTPEEIEVFQSLNDQRTILQEDIIPYLGFKNSFLRDGFEADDLLAIWSRKLFSKYNVTLITTDCDMYQCLDYCNIFNPSTKKIFTHEDLKEQFKVNADQWAYAKAIGGCSGDGVLGIYGVSDPKKSSSKALKYINGELTKGKIFDLIESKEGKEIISRNLPIVTTPYKIEKLDKMILRRDKFKIRNFVNIFEQYNFMSFLKPDKFEKWKYYFTGE